MLGDVKLPIEMSYAWFDNSFAAGFGIGTCN